MAQDPPRSQIKNEFVPSNRPPEASRSQGLSREVAVDVVASVPLLVVAKLVLVVAVDGVEVAVLAVEVCHGLGGLVVLIMSQTNSDSKKGHVYHVSAFVLGLTYISQAKSICVTCKKWLFMTKAYSKTTNAQN